MSNALANTAFSFRNERPMNAFCSVKARGAGSIGDFVRAAFVAVLFALLLAGPGAYLAWTSQDDKPLTMAEAQAKVCEASTNACGMLTGSVKAN